MKNWLNNIIDILPDTTFKNQLKEHKRYYEIFNIKYEHILRQNFQISAKTQLKYWAYPIDNARISLPENDYSYNYYAKQLLFEKIKISFKKQHSNQYITISITCGYDSGFDILYINKCNVMSNLMKKKPEIPPELATFLARQSLSKTKKSKCQKCGAELQRQAGACYICLTCGESGGCG